jgi:hypothetical protein
MKLTTRARLAGVVVLLFTGCVGPVEIAPLPYAHPANPDAATGAMPVMGSSLAAPAKEDDTTDQDAGTAHDHMKGMPGMNHGSHGGHER